MKFKQLIYSIILIYRKEKQNFFLLIESLQAKQRHFVYLKNTKMVLL